MPPAPPDPAPPVPAVPHIAVIGTGSFGRNHVRIYRELASAGQLRLTALVDPTLPESSSSRTLSSRRGRDPYRSHPGPPKTPLKGAGFSPHISPEKTPGLQPLREPEEQIFPSIAQLLAARNAGTITIDAASVCVPTHLHYEITQQLLNAGIDVLVEKPIAATLDEARQLVALAASTQRILQVGHLERFNPAITAVRPLLNSPMFFEAHRLSVFTPRALDVDVVLDLMIHDLDIVLSFANSPVAEVRAVGLPILTPRVDIANVRVEFASGAVANFTASRVSTERVRKLRFFQPHQYVSIDYARQDVLLIDVPHSPAQQTAPQLATVPVTNPNPPTQPHPSAGLGLRKLEVQQGEPLRLEIEAFLHCVATRAQPAVSATDGLAALTLATQIREAMALHHTRANLDRFTL